jgi:hypothetical protein
MTANNLVDVHPAFQRNPLVRWKYTGPHGVTVVKTKVIIFPAVEGKVVPAYAIKTYRGGVEV